MNARLGQESAGDRRWYFHPRTNRNGELLRDTAQECCMDITNTRFRKKESKMWTHLSDGTLRKGQLDFILIRQKWRNSLKNTEAFNTFQSVGSDHRMVGCWVKLSFRSSKKPARREHYDYSTLRTNAALQSQFAVEVRNRFSCLTEEGDTVTERYQKFVESIGASSEALLPKKARRRRTDPSSDPRVDTARSDLFLAKDRYHQDPCEENREEVARRKDCLRTAYVEVEEEILKSKIRKVEEAADRCKNKESWNLVNEITGRTRVLQGDTLAPYLFIIVIDYIMTVTMEEFDSEPGFTIRPARSRRVGAEKLADLEFADDVALCSDTIEEAQVLLERLEAAANTVGLNMNTPKTKLMTVNGEESDKLTNSTGSEIEQVSDFIYLGSWVAASDKDFEVRKAKAWAACHKMKKVWSSGMRRNLKVRLFIATVESILLYGSETWTLTESMKKRVDGCYTRMLRMALNIDWRWGLTNKEVYGSLPRVTMKIQERRMRLAGHIQRHPELAAHQVLLWEPSHGNRSRGRPAFTYVDCLRKDTGLQDVKEIGGLMADRLLWRQRIDTRTLKPP
ncbi:hypothetical protein ACHWQZ_G011057 [Mnemiopsis leidyi]